MVKKFYSFLTFLLLLIDFMGAAHADTISFTAAVAEDGGAGNWDFNFITGNNQRKWCQPSFLGYGDPLHSPFYTLNLTQFDPSLGTLSRVNLSLSRTVDASVFCQASNPPTTFTYYLANRAEWTMSGSNLGDFTFDLTNYPDATAVTGIVQNTVSKQQTDNVSTQFTTGFTRFIGDGTFATELSEAAATGFSFGNGSDGSTLRVTAEATVSYDYTPVPLPPSVLLLGSSLCALAMWRSRALLSALK